MNGTAWQHFRLSLVNNTCKSISTRYFKSNPAKSSKGRIQSILTFAQVGHGCQQITKLVLRPKTYFQVNIYASPLRSRRVRSTLNFTAALISNSTWSSPSTPTPIRPWNHPLKVNTDRKSHCYSSDKQDAMEVPRLVCPPDDYIIGLENLISKVATPPCSSSATSLVMRIGGGGSFVTRGDENIE